MKFFKFLPALALIFSVSSQATDINNQEFLSFYQSKVANILNNYPQNEGKKLSAQIFDINNNAYLGFLKTSKGYKKPSGDVMAMMYYDKFKVNNEDTSFCFVLYDSKSNLVNSYLKNTLLDYDTMTTYLVMHEMGHCLYAHKFQIGNVKEKITERENEQIADMFSVAYFSVQGQKENAVKIIRQTRRVDPKDIHSNGKEVENFFILFNDLNNIEQYSDFGKLFEITFKVFLDIRNNKIN
jgi:hypothetical protein